MKNYLWLVGSDDVVMVGIKWRHLLWFLIISGFFIGEARAQSHPVPGAEILQQVEAIDALSLPLDQIDTTRIIAKATLFELFSSALETGVFAAFYGTSAATTGTFFTFSLLSAGAVYAVHEYAWEVLSPSDNEELNSSRVALKTVSYRIVSIVRSLTLGSLLGGAQLAQSLGFVATYTVLDSILYASTEYLDGFLARSRREGARSIL